jgi:hypothetical protein
MLQKAVSRANPAKLKSISQWSCSKKFYWEVSPKILERYTRPCSMCISIHVISLHWKAGVVLQDNHTIEASLSFEFIQFSDKWDNLMSQSQQTLHLVPATKLLEIILRNKCWPTTFHTITVRDANGWCWKWLVWSTPHTELNMSASILRFNGIADGNALRVKLQWNHILLSYSPQCLEF